MDPIEDGDVAELCSLVARAPDRVRYERGLVALVARRDDVDRHAVAVRRPELLGLTLGRSRDHAERGGDDALARAVVLLELDDGRVRVVALEAADVAHVGAPPAVNALVVVADDAKVPVTLYESAQEAVLDRVRVLEFVDEHVIEAAADLFPLGSVLEEPGDEQNEVLEVDRVRPAEPLL